MKFEIVSRIEDVEIIATGSSISVLTYWINWIKIMDTVRQRFAVCIDNTDYKASLIERKIYEVIPDEKAAQDDLIRITDESGEDYLYHISQFVLIEFPTEVEQILAATSLRKTEIQETGCRTQTAPV